MDTETEIRRRIDSGEPRQRIRRDLRGQAFAEGHGSQRTARAVRRAASRSEASRAWRTAVGFAGPARGFSFENLWSAGRDHRPEVSSVDLIREMREGWQ